MSPYMVCRHLIPILPVMISGSSRSRLHIIRYRTLCLSLFRGLAESFSLLPAWSLSTWTGGEGPNRGCVSFKSISKTHIAHTQKPTGSDARTCVNPALQGERIAGVQLIKRASVLLHFLGRLRGILSELWSPCPAYDKRVGFGGFSLCLLLPLRDKR